MGATVGATYRLDHLLYRSGEDIILSAKCLGFYRSLENARDAIRYYNKCPGFCDNKDGYSVTAYDITGCADDFVYETMVYIHTVDYEMEYTVDLGIYGDREKAQTALSEYCDHNKMIFQIEGLVTEKIINRYVIDHKEWAEGFDVG